MLTCGTVLCTGRLGCVLAMSRRCLAAVRSRAIPAPRHTTRRCLSLCRVAPLRVALLCSAARWRTLAASVARLSTKAVPAAVQAKKRPSQRSRASNDRQHHKHPDLKVVACSTAEEYDLDTVRSALDIHSTYRLLSLSEDAHDVLHVKISPDTEPLYDTGQHSSTRDHAHHEVFLFREGTAVFWNVPPAGRTAFLHFLHAFEASGYDVHAIEEESDMMPFTYMDSGGCSRLTAGRIVLETTGGDPSSSSADDDKNCLALQKYAFSNALSLSVKLGMWEAALDEYTDSMRSVTDDLQRGGAIRMRKEEVLRKVGQLFSLRHLINLSSDCLDTPDFYWDRHQLEQLYLKTSNYLHIAKRTRVMNEKLNHCVELADMLTSSLQDQHHVRLEWMIIALIMIEVGFEAVHFVERYM